MVSDYRAPAFNHAGRNFLQAMASPYFACVLRNWLGLFCPEHPLKIYRYWYLFTVLWIIAGETESFSSNSLLTLYMKSHPTKKYRVSQLNNYPTGVPAVGIVSTLFWATLTDFIGGKRYLVGYWIAITGVITSALILAYPDNTSLHFGAYYWAGSFSSESFLEEERC